MHTLTIVGALPPLIGLVVGAVLQYIFGRHLELRKQLTLQKGQAYADYFRAMSDSATGGATKATLALATDAKTRVCIYGSSDVVRRLGDFERAGAAVTPGDGHTTVVNLLRAMRKDLGVSGDAIGEDDLRQALLGGRGKAAR